MRVRSNNKIKTTAVPENTPKREGTNCNLRRVEKTEVSLFTIYKKAAVIETKKNSATPTLIFFKTLYIP